MSEVKRYNAYFEPDPRMIREEPWGIYVLAADYDAERQRRVEAEEALGSLVESASHVVHKNDCMCGWCCTMAGDIQTARAHLAKYKEEQK